MKNHHSKVIEVLNKRDQDPCQLRSDYHIPKIFFNHIHKTGGGTLKRVLQQFKCNNETLTLSRHYIPQRKFNDTESKYFRAGYQMFRDWYRDATYDGVTYLDTHENFHSEISRDWIKLVFIRPALSRLRSHLNAVFDPMHANQSIDLDKDRRLLMNGQILSFFDRKDPFSIQVRQRILNTMSREILRDQYFKDIDKGFFSVCGAIDENAWLERYNEQQFRTLISRRGSEFDIIGDTHDFRRSLGLMCLQLGLPFQWDTRSVHVRSQSTKDIAHQIVSSIDEKVLERLLRYDNITYQELSKRREAIIKEESQRNNVHLSSISLEELGEIVDRSFLNQFQDHLRRSNAKPLDDFLITPERGFLGWGLGVRREHPKSKHAFFRLEPNAKAGFHCFAHITKNSRLNLIGLKGGFIENKAPLVDVGVNHHKWVFDGLNPMQIEGVEMPLVCASFRPKEGYIPAYGDIQSFTLTTVHKDRYIRLFAIVLS